MKIKNEFIKTTLNHKTDITCSKLNATILNSEDGKLKRAEIIMMESGWNLNDIFFPKSVIQEIVDVALTKPKVFLNHDIFAFMGRDVGDWVGNLTEVRYSESGNIAQAIATLEFTNNPDTVWIYDEISKNADSVQFSTHLKGYTVESEKEGRKGTIFEKLAEYRSLDVVSYAAAGGKALETLNSLAPLFPTIQQNTELIGHLSNPELVTKFNEVIENHLKSTKGESTMEIKTVSDLKTAYPQLVQEAINSETTKKDINQKLETVTNLETQVNKLKESLNTLTDSKEGFETQVNTLTKERDSLKLKVDEFETKIQINEWKIKVDEAIVDSKIDSKFVSDVFLNSLYKETDMGEVTSKIDDRVKLVSDNASVINNGINKKDPATEDKIDLKDLDSIALDIKSN